jgi:chemosensory pili system protein ChpA (sensor histidine kinase/response regulator)
LKATAQNLGSGPLQKLFTALSTTLSALPLPGSGRPINEALAMEYATSLLLAESALENYGRSSAEFAQQVDAMVQRIEYAARDLPPPPEATAIPLLDEMSRKAQERLLVSHVVREIQANLRHIEQVLDGFFRDQSKREELSGLGADIAQIQGALRMLGLDKAGQLLAHCQGQIEQYAGADLPVVNEDLESLAESLSGFGFYLEAVSQQRSESEAMIARLLRKRLGQVEEPLPGPEDTVEASLKDQREQLTPLLDALQQQPDDHGARSELKQQLEAVKQDADLVADTQLSEHTATALSLLDKESPAASAALSETVQAIASGGKAAAPAPPPSEETMRLLSASGEKLDAELLEIYLTEADEVLDTVADNLAVCRAEPHNVEALRIIRRGFHTLKGSGRMVGLHELGELAWNVERRMNRWLEEEHQVMPVMLAMIEVAQSSFRNWIGQLQATGRVEADAGPLDAALAAVDEVLSGAPPSPPASPRGGGPASAPGSGGSPEVGRGGALNEMTSAPPGEAGASAFGAVVESSLGSESEAEMLLAQSASTAEIVIGGVRVSRSLYDILTEEAQQHIATLRNEYAALQFDPHARPSDPMVRAAHTLCGIHRTAGFALVAQAAHVLEQALLALQGEQAPPVNTAATHLADAIDLLSDLVDRIAAQQSFTAADEAAAARVCERLDTVAKVKSAARVTDSETRAAQLALVEDEPAITEIQVLPPLDHEPEPDAAVVPSAATADDLQEIVIDLQALPDAPLIPEPQATAQHSLPPEFRVRATLATAAVAGFAAVAASASVPMPSAPTAEIRAEAHEAAAQPAPPIEVQEVSAEAISFAPAPLAEPLAPVELDATASLAQPQWVPESPSAGSISTAGSEAVEAALVPALNLDDPLAGVRDDVDTQLLPIFMEEAQELFPQASEHLRQWRKNPGSNELPRALQRTLHTFKGSARMAGAMRLGQLAHLMESRLLGERPVVPGAELFDALDSDLDRVAFVLDRLQRGEFNTVLPEFAAVAVPAVAPEAEPAEPAPMQAPPAAATPATPEVAPPVAAQPIGPIAAPQRAQAPGRRHEDLVAAQAALATVGPEPAPESPQRSLLRVRADLVDRLVNEAGEISISRSRVEGELRTLKANLLELTNSVIRLRGQVREIEIQAESQIQSSLSLQHEAEADFDPLEFDRYTRFQELSRSLSEGVNDVSTVQQALLKNLDDADTALHVQARLNHDVQQELLAIRTVPFDSLSERLYRIMRQTAKELDKKANLEITGGQVELDRSVVEKLVAPLEHLLRNALDHGIEGRAGRLAVGKPEIGEIALSFRQEGNEVRITLTDDGGGMDLAGIRKRAESIGLIPTGSEPTEAQLVELTFTPGFSTADQVTQISGRGIGMDVVRNEIAALGGRVDVATRPGQGTTFSIYLPLTLAVAQTVLVRAGGRLYALPSPLVQQVQQLKAEQLINLYVSHKVAWQGETYPFYYLPRLLGDEQHHPDTLRYNAILLLRSGTQHVAIHVDHLFGNQEVVVKNIGTQLARVPGITGATVLGSGEIVLILNPVQLVQRMESLALYPQAPAPPAAVEPEKAGLVMVVDDSLTVRKITSRFLTRSGYEVITAKDGVDALQELNEALPDVILLDIEMPRMDGFEFAKTVKNDVRTKHIPIIMITSRTAEKHRNHAKELGVEVYLGKPYQEEELLGHIKSLTV